MASSEEWRDAPGFEGRYSVSSLGRVRTEGRGRGRTPGRVLKASPAVNGYRVVTLWANNTPTMVYVHRLVCTAFNGPPPDTLRFNVLHGDGDRLNNLPGNLRWGTAAENVADTVRHGRMRNGQADKTHCAQGHPYDEGNTYRTPQGGRGCKTCRVQRTREWRERNKGVSNGK